MIPLLLLSFALHADRLTLPQALAEARAVNVTLPVARADVASAEAKTKEARAGLYPRLELDADVQVGRPGAYADSHALAKVLAATTLFDAGRRRAALRASLAELRGASQGLRKADVELSLEVRLRFDELTAVDEEQAVRAQALERLRGYLSVLEGRRAGGLGVGADALKTKARVASDAAELEGLARARGDAAQAFNDLLGRDPTRPLLIAPPPDLAVEAGPGLEAAAPAGAGPPELAQAKAQLESLQAQLDAASAERLPRIDARAELGGIKPMFGSGLAANDVATAPGEGLGGAVGLSLSWPLWDFGAIDARVAQAHAGIEKARAEVQLAARDARLQRSLAQSDALSLARELSLRREAEPLARDAYLSTESLYRGGVGSALEVLDAYGAWVDAAVKTLTARAALRDARARLLRWEGR
jgi:outer membrane protein TolC